MASGGMCPHMCVVWSMVWSVLHQRVRCTSPSTPPPPHALCYAHVGERAQCLCMRYVSVCGVRCVAHVLPDVWFLSRLSRVCRTLTRFARDAPGALCRTVRAVGTKTRMVCMARPQRMHNARAYGIDVCIWWLIHVRVSAQWARKCAAFACVGEYVVCACGFCARGFSKSYIMQRCWVDRLCEGLFVAASLAFADLTPSKFPYKRQPAESTSSSLWSQSVFAGRIALKLICSVVFTILSTIVPRCTINPRQVVATFMWYRVTTLTHYCYWNDSGSNWYDVREF